MILVPTKGPKEGIWGIKVSGAFIFHRRSKGLELFTCVDLFRSSCMYW